MSKTSFGKTFAINHAVSKKQLLLKMQILTMASFSNKLKVAIEGSTMQSDVQLQLSNKSNLYDCKSKSNHASWIFSTHISILSSLFYCCYFGFRLNNHESIIRKKRVLGVELKALLHPLRFLTKNTIEWVIFTHC